MSISVHMYVTERLHWHWNSSASDLGVSCQQDLRNSYMGARSCLLGLVLQALKKGGQRKAKAPVAHVRRQMRRKA